MHTFILYMHIDIGKDIYRERDLYIYTYTDVHAYICIYIYIDI